MTGASFEIERREVPRLELGRPARLKPNEWSSIEVDVVNFSTVGFRARCDALLKIGSYAAIQIPGIGSVQAKIVWQKNGEIGAKFVQPIDRKYCGWFGAEPPAGAEEAEAVESVAALLSRRVEMRIGVPPAPEAPEGGAAEGTV